MGEVFIISTARTPIGVGKPTGKLNPILPVDLGAIVMQEVTRRAGIDPEYVEDVIWGCVTQVGDQGANLARLSVLKAGFPYKIPAVTLSRMCGSSQQAIHFAAQAIVAGDMDVVIAGGAEMMSRVPLGKDYPERWPDGFPYRLVHQGTSAEMMAERWRLTREQLDDFSYQSHIQAMHAIQNGYFESQIIPIPLPGGDCMKQDEGVRMPPDRERMAALKPVFKHDGVITAGNSSQVSDGAAGVLLASARAVGRLNLTPIARIVSRVVVGSDPVLMLDGPIPATKKVLDKADLTLDQLDVIEINEAFASVVLSWAKELEIDVTQVNTNGGAIALGHPLGASGGVLMNKLVHELQRTKGQYGLQTMCIGHGMATATLIERV
jgi:acetyl-CoA acyltransferase